MVRIFISTGEVSGDLQGALLIQALRHRASQMGIEVEIMGLGGDRMAAAGATLVGNTAAIGSIGLVEILPFIVPTLRLQRRARSLLRQFPPDVVVLIDYVNPNVVIGRYIRSDLPPTPIVYYIAPQEWVWSFNHQNTQQIVGLVDRLLAIFPAEARYYQERGASVCYVGHPLLDRVSGFPTRLQAREALGIPPEQRAIALLPASRRQEINDLLPIIAQAARLLQDHLPDVHFWIPLSLELYRPFLEAAVRQYGLRATLVSDRADSVIAAADLAITKSGTVNLELALMNVPQVVLYRVNPVTAWIARNLLKFSVPFMSPVNLVLMEPIVPEFLQEAAMPDPIADTARDLLLNANRRQQTLQNYQRMQQALGVPGVCDRAANEILNLALSP